LISTGWLWKELKTDWLDTKFREFGCAGEKSYLTRALSAFVFLPTSFSCYVAVRFCGFDGNISKVSIIYTEYRLVVVARELEILFQRTKIYCCGWPFPLTVQKLVHYIEYNWPTGCLSLWEKRDTWENELALAWNARVLYEKYNWIKSNKCFIANLSSGSKSFACKRR
jgi:hypothetical protein